MDYENNNSVDFDESESIWKIDGPIGRKDYLRVQIGILILCSIFYYLLKIYLVPLLVIIGLVVAWLTFVSMSKRFYDITGSLKTGVIITIVVFLSNAVLPIISGIAIIGGAAIPGKLIKAKH